MFYLGCLLSGQRLREEYSCPGGSERLHRVRWRLDGSERSGDIGHNIPTGQAEEPLVRTLRSDGPSWSSWWSACQRRVRPTNGVEMGLLLPVSPWSLVHPFPPADDFKGPC